MMVGGVNEGGSDERFDTAATRLRKGRFRSVIVADDWSDVYEEVSCVEKKTRRIGQAGNNCYCQIRSGGTVLVDRLRQ